VTESDETLYSRFLAERNEEDFRVLLERHRESLTLFLNEYVHDLDDAEDLMLDAYAEAAAGTAAFSGKSSFKTWLFAIGKNKARMYLRKKRFPLFRREDLPDPSPGSPETDILKKERDRQLYRALSELKEEYRQILILMCFEGMSHEEAGRVMGKTRRQTYHLAERGRQALREKLERMGFEDAQY